MTVFMNTTVDITKIEFIVSILSPPQDFGGSGLHP